MIHMVLQGKGGVGKSFVAALMAQYLQDRGEQPLCIDTDPVNATFAGYAAFNVHRIDLMDGRDINPRRFDLLVETITGATRDQHVIIDNGASSFLPLADYILSYDVPELLLERGHDLCLHTVITGGQGQDDTLQGLTSLIEHFTVPIAVWLNPFCGRIEKDGNRFADMWLYKEHKNRVAGVVEIPEFNAKTTGIDLSALLKTRRPFREAVNDPSLLLMTRQRLRMAQRELYARLDLAAIL
ncbi:MAG TPA: ArsA-related P-loop ATPase [Polyangiales bacterium]